MASSSTSSDDKSRRRRAVESVGEKAQDVLYVGNTIGHGFANCLRIVEKRITAKPDPLRLMQPRAARTCTHSRSVTRVSASSVQQHANSTNAKQGIAYFLTHKALWKPFKSRLGSYLTLSASVVGGMFALTYVPQLAVQVFVSGPFAVFTTVLLVLNESSAIINAVSRGWLLQDSILDTFDGTLVARGATGVLGSGRELKGGRAGRDPIQRLGKVLKNPFERFGPTALVRYLMYLPLNFIPVVGTLVYLFVQGGFIFGFVC